MKNKFYYYFTSKASISMVRYLNLKNRIAFLSDITFSLPSIYQRFVKPALITLPFGKYLAC